MPDDQRTERGQPRKRQPQTETEPELEAVSEAPKTREGPHPRSVLARLVERQKLIDAAKK